MNRIATALLSSAALLLGACTNPDSYTAPAGLAVHTHIPAEVAAAATRTSAQAVPGSAQVSAAELEQVSFRLILVDDIGLSSGGDARERLVSDLEAETPAPASEASYLTRGFTWSPGGTSSLEISNLTPERRYLIVLAAELAFSGGADSQIVYGYTRAQTRAGATTVAPVVVQTPPAELVADLLEWYGIEVSLEHELDEAIPPEVVITISNTGVPEFAMNPSAFQLNVTTNDQQLVSVTTTEAVTHYTWLINGESILSGEEEDSLTLLASWATSGTNFTVLGTNTLTLIVEIDGLPYSDDFFFTVEEN